MKLSPFMKEHKENLKKMTKKQLINQILMLIEMEAQSKFNDDRKIVNLEKQKNDLEGWLKSAESSIAYKDSVIEKYKQVLDFTIEMP